MLCLRRFKTKLPIALRVTASRGGCRSAMPNFSYSLWSTVSVSQHAAHNTRSRDPPAMRNRISKHKHGSGCRSRRAGRVGLRPRATQRRRRHEVQAQQRALRATASVEQAAG